MPFFRSNHIAQILNKTAIGRLLGFTPEDVANKSTDGTFSANSDILYPSQKAAKAYVDNKIVSATNVSVTTANVGNSTNLDVFLQNLDASITSQGDCGFDSWGGAGNYYSIATNQFTLLRPGTGYIRGKKVTWTAPQTTIALTAYAAHWIYIDSAGVIGVATARTDVLYDTTIPLFEVYYDGVNYKVVIENHSATFDSAVQEFLHETVGTVLTVVEGGAIVGADMVRKTTGTGGVATDRQVYLLGDAIINDNGLMTDIVGGTTSISWSFYYTNAVGRWVEYGTGTDFPMLFNNAGTMTAIGTGGSTDHAIWTCYAVKANPNTLLPMYIAVADTTRYATAAQCLAAISNGTNAQMTGALFQALEPAQLGHVILFNNGSGGYIEVVSIAKSTARSNYSAGGASTASGITVDTATFTKNLSASDNTVQAALNTLDQLTTGGNQEVKFSVTGTLLPVTGIPKWYPDRTITLSKVYFSLGTISIGSTAIDVKKNGVSIFTGPLPTATAGNTKSTEIVPTTTSLLITDYLTVDIITASGGSYLTAVIVYS